MPAPDCTVRPGVPRRLAAMFYEALLMFAVLAVTFVLPHVLIGAFAHRLAMATLLWAHQPLIRFVVIYLWRK